MDTIKVASIRDREDAIVGQVTAMPDNKKQELKFTVAIAGSRGKRIADLLNEHARITLAPYRPAIWVEELNCPEVKADPCDLENLLLAMSGGELTVEYDEAAWEKAFFTECQLHGPLPASPIRQLIQAYLQSPDNQQIDWLNQFEQAFIWCSARAANPKVPRIPVPLRSEPALSAQDKERIQKITEEALDRYKQAH